MEFRIEQDSLGEIEVPVDFYWGAQTQRSFENFPIGNEIMPEEVIRAISVIKYAAAKANKDLGKLDSKRSDLICKIAEEIYSQPLNDFPLVVWQTGSGTQSNMNVNEVIANKGNELVGEKLLHPNDHVNMSQSSNDVFPTAMHIASIKVIIENLIPSIDYLIESFIELEKDFKDIYKVGRTHLQDAVPLSFSQEISSWRMTIENDKDQILLVLDNLREVPIGGTAVGTGLNTPKGFDKLAAQYISQFTGQEVIVMDNKFSGISCKSAIANTHGALKILAADLLKITNDIRFLASGPRAGIGELILPANEPGSSIMPGKVNPTQAEALAMVCLQVMGNDVTIGFAASQGHFQLNTYMPLIIYNFLQSVTLLTDSINSFTKRCVSGIKPNREVINYYLENSLMVATALNTSIGYDKASKAVKYAHDNNLSLKEACLALDILTEEEYNDIINISEMVGE